MIPEAIKLVLSNVPTIMFVAAIAAAFFSRRPESVPERYLAWLLLLAVGVDGIVDIPWCSRIERSLLPRFAAIRPHHLRPQPQTRYMLLACFQPRTEVEHPGRPKIGTIKVVSKTLARLREYDRADRRTKRGLLEYKIDLAASPILMGAVKRLVTANLLQCVLVRLRGGAKARS